jgi:ElaA protein
MLRGARAQRPGTRVTDCSIAAHPFTGLDVAALYDLLALRAAVFVVEQRCVYLDPDGLDPDAVHVLARVSGRLVGAARLLPPSIAGQWRIGRVVVAAERRGTGLGRALVQAAQAQAQGAQQIHLAAQAHLAAFYGSLGYRVSGPVHDEDGIPHVEMVLDCISAPTPPANRPRPGRT